MGRLEHEILVKYLFALNPEGITKEELLDELDKLDWNHENASYSRERSLEYINPYFRNGEKLTFPVDNYGLPFTLEELEKVAESINILNRNTVSNLREQQYYNLPKLMLSISDICNEKSRKNISDLVREKSILSGKL